MSDRAFPDLPPHPHPNIRGREPELASLADAVRRLVAVTVTNAAPKAETGAMARELHALADRFEAHVPETPVPRYAGLTSLPTHPDEIFPYDVMLGRFSPLALPIAMRWEDEHARGDACFTTPYEGPPGCVHGAVLAAAFDQVFNVANIMSGTAGPTRTLSLRYRRPTPLHAPLDFDGWIETLDERSIVCRGVVRHRGEVTVEAEGHFARVTHEHIQQMGERAREASD